MPGRIHGDEPRPWALVFGVEDDSPLRAEVERLFPTVLFAEPDEPLRFGEFDVVIAVGDVPYGVAGDTHVIQFGGTPSAGTHAWALVVDTGSFARLFTTAEAADDVAELADTTLVPGPGSHYEVLRLKRLGTSPAPIPALEGFAKELGGAPLAGGLDRRRGNESGELWWLPERTPRRAAWVAAALKRWQAADPARFPNVEGWRAEPEWTTEAERRAGASLQLHEETMAARLTELLEERTRLQAALAEAQAAADARERRLLTAQGSELVEAVADLLRELGFEVQDADELPENAAAKREDLRIIDGTWTCLAEVKGYAKRGAKAGDLLQLGRAVEAFILRLRRLPDARWYIVNQSSATPPAERPRPLHGSPDLPPFETSGGLVVDTRDLFRLRETVRRGDLDAPSARLLLRDARGVLEYPPVEGAN